MSSDTLQRLVELRDRLLSYVEGRDRSIRFVSQIEGLLVGELYDDERFEELIVAVAMYNPDSPELLHEEHLLPVCKSAITIIDQCLQGASE